MEDFSFEADKKGLWGKIYPFRWPLSFLLGGLSLLALGILVGRTEIFKTETKVEILEPTGSSNTVLDLVVEVSGAVEKPGVYKLSNGTRIEDALILAGGFSASADRLWIEKYLNRAAKIIDGQKIFIPATNSNNPVKDEHSNNLSANNSGGDQTISSNISQNLGSLININTASLKELDALPGIGPVYGQNIIDQRPYSNTEELLSRSVLKKYVYEKIKNLITIY